MLTWDPTGTETRTSYRRPITFRSRQNRTSQRRQVRGSTPYPGRSLPPSMLWFVVFGFVCASAMGEVHN